MQYATSTLSKSKRQSAELLDVLRKEKRGVFHTDVRRTVAIGQKALHKAKNQNKSILTSRHVSTRQKDITVVRSPKTLN